MRIHKVQVIFLIATAMLHGCKMRSASQSTGENRSKAEAAYRIKGINEPGFTIIADNSETASLSLNGDRKHLPEAAQNLGRVESSNLSNDARHLIISGDSLSQKIEGIPSPQSSGGFALLQTGWKPCKFSLWKTVRTLNLESWGPLPLSPESSKDFGERSYWTFEQNATLSPTWYKIFIENPPDGEVEVAYFQIGYDPLECGSTLMGDANQLKDVGSYRVKSQVNRNGMMVEVEKIWAIFAVYSYDKEYNNVVSLNSRLFFYRVPLP